MCTRKINKNKKKNNKSSSNNNIGDFLHVKSTIDQQ